ncbi:MAG TPA: tail tape measure protein [Sphingomonadaceae bacterium]|nr:tail tape measure protein [Sphingomonadaceae bacterium]
MDDDFERGLVRVRADTGAWARDVAEMRAQLTGPLAAGADQAGRMIEGALGRAIRTGKFGFEDLKRIALSTLAEIAEAAVRAGIGAVGGGSGGGGSGAGGLLSVLGGLAGSMLGPPGRATGGGVSPGRAYTVGERGPELFVPTSAGRVETGGFGVPREVRVTINVQSPQAGAPEALTRSSRQIARAVRQAMMAPD